MEPSRTSASATPIHPIHHWQSACQWFGHCVGQGVGHCRRRGRHKPSDPSKPGRSQYFPLVLAPGVYFVVFMSDHVWQTSEPEPKMASPRVGASGAGGGATASASGASVMSPPGPGPRETFSKHDVDALLVDLLTATP